MIERFRGKVAIVTGGSAGIGAAIARRLAVEGAQVMVAGRNPLDDAGIDIAFHRTDVGALAEVRAMVDATVARFGRLDMLVNNVGVGVVAETADLEEEDWQRLLRLNLSSVFHGCKCAMPHMREQGGAILNLSSVAGLAGDYGMGAYNATKAAVINYTRSLALDGARNGIRANVLCPGAIGDTQVKVGSHGSASDQQAWIDAIPLGRLGTSDEMASVATFLLSEEARYMTGAVVVADGGMSAWTGMPNALRRRRLLAGEEI